MELDGPWRQTKRGSHIFLSAEERDVVRSLEAPPQSLVLDTELLPSQTNEETWPYRAAFSFRSSSRVEIYYKTTIFTSRVISAALFCLWRCYMYSSIQNRRRKELGETRQRERESNQRVSFSFFFFFNEQTLKKDGRWPLDDDEANQSQYPTRQVTCNSFLFLFLFFSEQIYTRYYEYWRSFSASSSPSRLSCKKKDKSFANFFSFFSCSIHLDVAPIEFDDDRERATTNGIQPLGAKQRGVGWIVN